MTIGVLRRRIDDVVEDLEASAPELDDLDLDSSDLDGEFEPASITLLKRAEKGLARSPLARLSTVVPRTGKWAYNAVRTEAGRIPGAPEIRMTGSLAAHVAMDEAVIALVQGPKRTPRRADYLRVSSELRDARELYEAKGWIDDPSSYHREPEPLTADHVSAKQGWALGERYRRISWHSGFEARPEEPGAERWNSFRQNRTASAWVLEHEDGPRPWMVCVHGFGTGAPFADLITFRAPHVFHELGWNIAAIVLPVHGSRRPSRIGGEYFLGFDMMNSVHALTQSVWDIRRLLTWVRAQNPEKVVLHGVSLGGYITALMTCFDGELDAAISGIPVVDFPALFAHQSPIHVRERCIEHGIINGNAEAVLQVVSPLGMPCRIPRDDRYIFAGLGDRMAIPTQAHELWEHWDRPVIRWFPGNHVGYLWSSKVADFMDSTLESVSPARPDY